MTLWWLDHPLASWQLPLLDEQDLRGRGRRLGKFDLDYVTLRYVMTRDYVTLRYVTV